MSVSAKPGLNLIARVVSAPARKRRLNGIVGHVVLLIKCAGDNKLDNLRLNFITLVNALANND